MPDDPSYALTEESIEHFVEHGYVVVRDAFPNEEARRLVRATFEMHDPAPWIDYRVDGGSKVDRAVGDMDLNDPSTWDRHSLNLHTGRELEIATFAPKLWGAIRSLIGRHESRRRTMGQLWKVNANYAEGPPPPLNSKERTRGWHLDAPTPPTTLEDRTDALVLLALWSDVEPNGGGTRYRPATLELLVRTLEAHPEGVDVEAPAFMQRLYDGNDEVLEVTGRAGDVVITHSFMFHTASRNYRRTIRILENTMINVEAPLDYSHENAHPSPVERCVIRRLSKERVSRAQWLRRGAEHLSTRHPDSFWPDRRAFSRRVAPAEQRRVAELDQALTLAWARQVVGQFKRSPGSVTHMITTCAAALRRLLVTPALVPRGDGADDGEAPFAALLSGVAGPVTRARLIALTLKLAGLEVEIAAAPQGEARALPVRVMSEQGWLGVGGETGDRVEPQRGAESYHPVIVPSVRTIEELLAATPLPEGPEPEPDFRRYLALRIEEVVAPSEDRRAAYRALALASRGRLGSTLCRWLGTPPSERQRAASARPRRHAPVVALAPLPRWARELAGDDAESATLTIQRDRLYVRFVGASDRRVLIDPDELSAHEVSREGPRPLPNGEAVLRRHRRSIELCRARLRWIASVHLGLGAGGYRPTPAEAAYAALQVWVARGGSQPAPSGIAEVDGFADEVARFDLLRRRHYAPLFALVDAGEPESPLVAALALALSGDTARLRERLSPEPEAPSPRGLVIAHVLAWLGLDAPARAYMERCLETIPPRRRPDVLLPLAKLAARLGEHERAVEHVRAATLLAGDDPAFIARAAEELVELGAVGDALLVLEHATERSPDDAQLALALGEIYAWAGDYVRAEQSAERARQGQDAARLDKLRGITLYGRGRDREALPLFQRAAQGRHRSECYLFMAELYQRLGDRDRARHYLEQSRLRAQSMAHLVLGHLIHEDEFGPKLRAVQRTFEPDGAPAGASEDDPEGLCRRVLAGMRGNRTERLTWAPGAGPVHPTALRPVRVSADDEALASRDASADAMKKIATHPLAAVIEEMNALEERYPLSPHPACYRGELWLWLGEYDRAHADFVAAERHRRARWAYVGRAAVYLFRGEHARAREELALCTERFEPVPGATTQVYLGEIHRLTGDLEGAKRELRRAVEAKPGRIGAWMNLALAHQAASEEPEARRIFERVAGAMPRLLWDARRALGDDVPWPVPFEHMPRVFEKALEMMRGNRSSHLVTYFDAAGTFRVARSATELTALARKWSNLLVEELGFRLSRAGPWEAELAGPESDP